MATCTRKEYQIAMADRFQCSDCNAQFLYGPGFPEYCPECGEEFEATEDETEQADD